MEILIPTIAEYQVLTYHTNKKISKPVIMCGITEKEERAIDNKKEITVIKKDINNEHKFKISLHNVLCYGTVDLTDGSDDRPIIERFHFLDNLGFGGYPIESFNYSEGTYTGTWFSTWNPFLVCQLAHCRIGKPERIAIFKDEN